MGKSAMNDTPELQVGQQRFCFGIVLGLEFEPLRMETCQVW